MINAKRCWMAASLLITPAIMSSTVQGQNVPPFIGGAATAFDVQVSVVESGALLDAQAVVSQDRRYVTINAQPSNTSLLALQQFRTQTVNLGTGFVGGADPSGLGANAASTPVDGRSPSAIAQAAKNNASVLNRRGVFLLSPLK